MVRVSKSRPVRDSKKMNQDSKVWHAKKTKFDFFPPKKTASLVRQAFITVSCLWEVS